MFKIPQSTKKFTQDNSSDVKGNISITKNISFDNSGYISLSKRVRAITDDVLLADLSNSRGSSISKLELDIGGSDIWALGTKNIYIANLQSGDTIFVKDSAVGTPTLDMSGEVDVVEFSDDMYVADGTALRKKVSSTWSTPSGLYYGGQTSLCVFKNLNQLACGVDNHVELINTSDVVQKTLNLPDRYSIIKMVWNRNRLFITTRDLYEKEAMLFVWDGLSSEANDGWAVDAHSIYSAVPYKNGCAVITSSGELLYNAGGWQVLDRLPIYYKKEVWQTPGGVGLSQKVAPHAMTTDGENIFIGVNAYVDVLVSSNTKRLFQDFPSGIWCFDPNVGLYHKYSIDSTLQLKTNDIATTSIDVSTNTITVAGATVPITGTPVFYYAIVSGIATPLEIGTEYFTIKLSDTTLKLASSYANAIAGTAIDITGTGSDTQYLVFNPVNTFGSSKGYISALAYNPSSQYKYQTEAGNLFVGGYTFDKTNAATSYIASVVDTQENRGYFVTPKLESDEVEDTWQKVFIKFKPLVNDADKIVVKFRTEDNTLNDYETYVTSNNYTHVWVDGNTYTTTQDISDVKARADANTLDEVEFYTAQGSGYTAHITSITETGGTYTVNIDETIPNVTAGDKVKVFYCNWTKLGEVTKDDMDNDKGYKIFTIDTKSKNIQLKVELRGNEIKVGEIIIKNETDKPLK